MNDIHNSWILDDSSLVMDTLKKEFKMYKLTHYLDALKPMLKPKIDVALTSTVGSNSNDVFSRMGGRPDLNINQVWPKDENGKSLSFIGQLKAIEVSKFDASGLFPKNGLLSFFYCSEQEAWGFDPKDKQRFRVIYTKESETVVKHEFPEDLDSSAIFKLNYLKFSAELSIPSFEYEIINEMIADEDVDNYLDLCEGSENQIFGYANCVQGTMELECQLVSNGLYCGDATGYEDPRRNELEKGANDWVLLFQVGSDEYKTGMIWGDSGTLFYWIKKQDLAKNDFDKAWLILQCG
jgi:uncharacterized protein YwqG